jgi:hypothetical protein
VVQPPWILLSALTYCAFAMFFQMIFGPQAPKDGSIELDESEIPIPNEPETSEVQESESVLTATSCL